MNYQIGEERIGNAEIFHVLASMGHGDSLVICDALGLKSAETVSLDLTGKSVLSSSIDFRTVRLMTNSSSVEICAISVTKEWLHKNLQAFGGVNHLSLVTGRGDSMADTFYDGDVLFVDQSVTSVKYDGIYVYSFEDRLYLKRLSLNFDGSIEVISDNSRYSTEIILPDQREGMFVHGRIVGVWQSKKL